MNGPRRPGLGVVVLLAAAATATACGGSPDSGPSSPSPSAPAPSQTTASAAPVPAMRACYDMTFDQALAPTTRTDAVDCTDAHTTMTYRVGHLDSLAGDHLLAVDSTQVQNQVATTCPSALQRFLGGDVEDLRLSMLRPVWFTPTVAESEAGQGWYRCDVIAVAGSDKLLDLTGRLKGVLDDADRAATYAMCGTAKPGTTGFERVPCGLDHTWKAISTVAFPAGDYPGVAQAKSLGEDTCKSAARKVADDALDYQWGYEYPTRAQWNSGQTYGVCWAPDNS
ncbi:MAG: septum formation family protein [Nocardioides sp.]|uniref:septum formation family protein n=1 Tax=Nocardioides sp. TaxID=35761 RepID=UPI0039E557D9